MADDIKVPGVGPLNKKKVLIGAGIGVAVVVVVVIMRRRSQAAAAAAAPVSPVTGADTSGTGYTDPNLDPATGFDYGTPQDQAALGGGGYYGGGGIGNTLSNIDPATGYLSGSPQDIAALRQLYGPHTTRAPRQSETQWISTAANALAQDAGVGRAAAAEALTEWIAGQQITAQQAQYVREALALTGNPPNGAPPIHVKPTHPGHQPDNVKVPDVHGQHYPAAREALADAGLKARAVPSGTGIVAYQAPRAGTEAERGSAVTLHMAATG